MAKKKNNKTSNNKCHYCDHYNKDNNSCRVFNTSEDKNNYLKNNKICEYFVWRGQLTMF